MVTRIHIHVAFLNKNEWGFPRKEVHLRWPDLSATLSFLSLLLLKQKVFTEPQMTGTEILQMIQANIVILYIRKWTRSIFLSFSLRTKQERNRKFNSYVIHKIVPYSSQDVLTQFTLSTPWMLSLPVRHHVNYWECYSACVHVTFIYLIMDQRMRLMKLAIKTV